MGPVKEAIFARLAILARHASQARRATLDSDGLRNWQYRVLLTLRRLGPPYIGSPSLLAEHLGLTKMVVATESQSAWQAPSEPGRSRSAAS
ncbi:hypothetical protein AB0D34_22075 [Streptomyces sp. NPDC048420]|uniref:hypothetical protein n=1 Tax=Streptomyces sp. NPDC048420 TaxID=3155755 RepID=UPI00344A8BB9